MAFEDHLTDPVQGSLGGIYLGKHVLAGHVVVHHAVNGLDLADDLSEAPVQIGRVHALSHANLPCRSVPGPVQHFPAPALLVAGAARRVRPEAGEAIFCLPCRQQYDMEAARIK